MEIDIVTFCRKGKSEVNRKKQKCFLRRVYVLNFSKTSILFSKSGLSMENTPSMYQYVKVNAKCSLSAKIKVCVNSASNEYRNMSARGGHSVCQFESLLSF